VASAFISYAHEDQEFVLALVPELQAQGLDIRYDQVALHVGDSLIRAISREITGGDFLIAIVSPDSVASEWCQHEVELAMTQGINERRVKVLPVRYRGAAIPPVLQTLFWADADRYDIEAIAEALTAAMRANLEGREDDAEQEAAAVEEAAAERQPPEPTIQMDVAQFDRVADKVWDVLAQWERCREGAPTAELVDQQRRLRWLLDGLPERVRDALPLVSHLSEADWGDYFRVVEPATAEPDVREELRSVRAQIAQGLPLTRRWMVMQGFGQVSAGNRDAVAYLWGIERGQETRRITVFISGTAMESRDEGLPQEVVAAKNTHGRSVLATLVPLDDPPSQVMVTTAGISLTLPD
jgi:TIR domain